MSWNQDPLIVSMLNATCSCEFCFQELTPQQPKISTRLPAFFKRISPFAFKIGLSWLFISTECRHIFESAPPLRMWCLSALDWTSIARTGLLAWMWPHQSALPTKWFFKNKNEKHAQIIYLVVLTSKMPIVPSSYPAHKTFSHVAPPKRIAVSIPQSTAFCLWRLGSRGILPEFRLIFLLSHSNIFVRSKAKINKALFGGKQASSLSHYCCDPKKRS